MTQGTRGGVDYDEEIFNLLVGNKLTVGEDIDAAGGYRQSLTFGGDALAASQTATKLLYGGVVGAAWVAPRAGSFTALSAQLSAAVTGSSKTVTVKIYKGGVAVATLQLTFTSTGAEVTAYATSAKDALTFAAGDLITVGYDSTAITNTPTIVVTLEVEC